MAVFGGILQYIGDYKLRYEVAVDAGHWQQASPTDKNRITCDILLWWQQAARDG